MESYVFISLGAALALTVAALLGKILLRYRICDPGLITWGQGVMLSISSLVLCVLFRLPFPKSEWLFVLMLALVLIVATRLLNQALQEGDASAVVPLLGLKIPMASLMAWLLLDESASAAIWLAVICAAGAVALFGVGPQEKTQGGHGRHAGIAILFAIGASLLFSSADIIARVASRDLDLRSLVLWANVLWGPVSVVMLTGRRFRKYKVGTLDFVLFFLIGAFVTGAMMALYYAFKLADSVILPNIIVGARGLFALAAGYILNKAVRVPLERQPGVVYIYRTIGTLLLLAALVILHIQT